MKKLILFCYSLFFLSAIAQVQIPAESQRIFNELARYQESEFLNWDSFQVKYPIYKMEGRWYLSTLIEVNEAFNKSSLPHGFILQTQIGSIATLKIPLEEVSQVYSLENVNIVEVAGKIYPQIDRAVKDMRVDSVKNGWGLPQGFSGKNVIIGVTDWGFDYTHPMFYDTLMQQNRILASWDQFKNSGPPPSGMNYGTLHDGTSQLLAAKSDTFCTYYEYATHGSHVAGIAGGGGAGIGLTSGAYEAEFLFCQLYLDAGSALDAVSWMQNYANSLGKRLVINMSWGLYHLGPLDGTSLISQGFNSFSDNGVVIVTSGGNNGYGEFHIKHNFQKDTILSKINFYTYSFSKMWGQSISMWGEKNNSFYVQLEVYNSNTKVATTPFIYSATAVAYQDSFLVVGSDTVWYNFTVDASYPTNQRPYIRMRVKNNSTLNAVLRAYADNGIVHFWNVTETTTGVGNWGMPFSKLNGVGLIGDSEYSIGEPACAEKVISIAAHNSQVEWPDGTIINGVRAPFSSIGPTHDGRIKPDISAPGVGINSSISSYTTEVVTPENTVFFNGKNYVFSKFSGTSMASPNVTSVVALMLEANPNLTAHQVKSILLATAREDNRTGVIPSGGSPYWGYGKITAIQAIFEALNYVGANEDKVSRLSIYPTVAKEVVRIDGDAKTWIRSNVYDVNGYIVLDGFFENNLNVSSLRAGTYIVVIETEKGSFWGSFIKLN